MEAYSHLTEWKSLQYCSTVNIDENSPPNLERMWSEPLYQVIILPNHVLGWETGDDKVVPALTLHIVNNLLDHCVIKALWDCNNHITFAQLLSAFFVSQEMYLPHMIRSMLKQLQLGEMDQSLLSFTDQAMMVEERKNLMESHYSQELSLLYILQEDYDRAKYYTNYAFELFIQVC